MAVNSKAIGVAYEDQQIISGQIDDTAIGSVTPNAGTFTNLQVNGLAGVGIAPISNRRLGVYSDRAITAYSQVWTTANAGAAENDVVLNFNGVATQFGNVQNFPCSIITNGSERFRITAAGNRVATQAAESAQNASVTLTVANLQAGIITSNAAVTLTLPTGTSLESYTSVMAADTAFECVFIATTANAITIGANGNTTVGSLTVAGNSSGTFRFRKTATNTFTVYRVA